MKRNILIAIVAFCSSYAFSQTDEVEYKRIKFGDRTDIVSGIDISPATGKFALSGARNTPLYIFNSQAEAVERQFEAENWYSGSALAYSKNGNYLLMEQLFYNYGSLNKDKKAVFKIINPDDGQVVKLFDGYNSVKISPDEKLAYALLDEEVSVWDLESGNKINSFQVAKAGYGIAVSNDGKTIAVAHKPDKKTLKKSKAFKKDKKGLKFTVKYKHQVSLFNTSNFSKERVIDVFFDFVYDMKFVEGDKELFVLQIPHDKASTGVDRKQTFIGIVECENWQLLRKGFVSRSLYLPDYSLSADMKYFAITSLGNRFAEVHVYDYESGKLYNRFELSYRFFEKSQGEFIYTDNRAAFAFLPDSKSMLVTMGNRLVLWNFIEK